jgi:DNA-binding response OmpR family regulator
LPDVGALASDFQDPAELRSIFSSALPQTVELPDDLLAQGLAEVLVVGDLKSRSSIVTALQDAGFGVVEATESIGALKHLLDETPQVVIISEKKSLVDEIRLMRSLRCFTTVPIILVGSGGFRSADESLLCRADAYLPKSFDVETLLAFLHALLTRN